MGIRKITDILEDVKAGDLLDIIDGTIDESTVVATGYALPYIASRTTMAPYQFSSGPGGPRIFSVYPYSTIFGKPGEIGSLKFKGKKDCIKVTHYSVRERAKE
jgi:hypothetical protein